MINSIRPGYRISVVGGSTYTPYIYHSQSPAGQIRYTGSQLEVFNGSNWIGLSTDAIIDLSSEVHAVIDWALKKMKQEEATEKFKDNPAIADLLKQKADIEDKLKVVQTLLQDSSNGSTSS